MTAKMTSTKRFVVRTALVTSTTLATILGAQALASTDGAGLIQPTAGAPTEVAVAATSGSAQVVSAAPDIVILRRAGDQPASAQTTTPPVVNHTIAQSPQVTLPNPVQVVPQQQIIIPHTRSSR